MPFKVRSGSFRVAMTILALLLTKNAILSIGLGFFGHRSDAIVVTTERFVGKSSFWVLGLRGPFTEPDTLNRSKANFGDYSIGETVSVRYVSWPWVHVRVDTFWNIWGDTISVAAIILLTWSAIRIFTRKAKG